MNLHELSPATGSNTKAYRKGRGHGSGNGKTAGRGHKGQWARSGGGVVPVQLAFRSDKRFVLLSTDSAI